MRHFADREAAEGSLQEPRDLALRSEHDGRYQFQYWAVSLVNANPAQNKKKGADGGVDGIKFFRDLDNGAHKIVVTVKSGKLKADDVRALMAVREREQAELALLISLERAKHRDAGRCRERRSLHEREWQAEGAARAVADGRRITRGHAVSGASRLRAGNELQAGKGGSER